MKQEHKPLMGDRHMHVDLEISPSGFGVPHEHAGGSTAHEHTTAELKDHIKKHPHTGPAE